MTFKELGAHIQTDHKETLKFSCDTCDYKTEAMVNVRRHRANLHKGNAIKCSVDGCDYSCTKTFKTVAKEFTCDYENCQYKTQIKHSLQIHKENIHLQIKHICEHCGFHLTTRSNLCQHSSNVHRNESDT